MAIWQFCTPQFLTLLIAHTDNSPNLIKKVIIFNKFKSNESFMAQVTIFGLFNFYEFFFNYKYNNKIDSFRNVRYQICRDWK